MSKTNYHSHTVYCGHSKNFPEDLIQLAIKKGYKVFGISEHLPIPKTRWIPTDSELSELINCVYSLKEKYKNEINIYMGLECEWHPEIYDIVKKYHDKKEIQYLIFGNHFVDMNRDHIQYILDSDDDNLLIKKQYEYAEKALSSGLFSCFAHPDIFLMKYKKWDGVALELTKKFISLSIKYDVPLELNINGLEMKRRLKNNFVYPYKYFWEEVAKTSCKVIIGVDTHAQDTMSDEYYNEINNFIDECNLRKNIVKFLKDKNGNLMD